MIRSGTDGARCCPRSLADARPPELKARAEA
jgi:hypothetical protein